MSGMPRQPGGPGSVKRPNEVREGLKSKQAQSYGQSAEPPTPEELKAAQQMEDLAGEPVREGEETISRPTTMRAWKKKED